MKRDRGRLLGAVLIGFGVVLVPWLFYLAVHLPDTKRAHNWSLMWTGIDVAEAVALLATGILQLRRDSRRSLVAAVAATLLVVDCWVDITTASSSARTMSLLSGLLLELPIAALCTVLAVRTFPARREGRREHEEQKNRPADPGNRTDRPVG